MNFLVNLVLKPFKSLFRSISGIFFTASVYVLLSVSVIILYQVVPTFQIKAIIILVIVLLMAVFTNVRIKLQDVTEKEVDDLKHENERLNKSLSEEKRKADNANELRSKQVSKFIDIKSILTISLLDIDLEHQQGFDFFISSESKERKPFIETKKEDYKDKAKRIVGYYKIPYTTRVGFDLSKVKVYVDQQTIYYSLPEIEINGVKPEKTSWSIKLEMEYDDKPFEKWDHWNLCQDDGKQNSIFEELVEESRQIINKELPVETKNLVSKTLFSQAEGIVSAILRDYTGLKPIRIQDGELFKKIASSGTKIIEYIEYIEKNNNR